MNITISSASESVIALINNAGGAPIIVGGFVRDALLERESTGSADVDVEVYGLEFDTLAEVFETMLTTKQSNAFGVLAVTCDGEDFDISLPRTDTRVGAGHKGFSVQVNPHLDFAAAFSRRDFTINAIGWNPATGEVIDPFNGQADIRTRTLRHINEAFTDDPLRVLRAAQLAARFGLTLAPETAALCRQTVATYNELPVERIWAEWQKITRHGVNISCALAVFEQTGWLEHYPELAATRGVEQDIAWHAEGDVFMHLGMSADVAAQRADCERLDPNVREVVVLAALLHDLGKVTTTYVETDGRITSAGHARAGVDAARSFLRSIGAPANTIARVIPLVGEHMRHVNVTPTASVVRRLMRRLEPSTIEMWARVCGADGLGRVPQKPFDAATWLGFAGDADVEMKAPARILTGRHLIANGFTPGPAFKQVLAQALTAQDNGAFDDVDGATRWLATTHPHG